MKRMLLTVVETAAFIKAAEKALSDEERSDLVDFLADNPEAGDVMPETGGVRKLRWARQGEGKSGGYRVIYYYHNVSKPLFLITMYPKNKKENLTQAEKNSMRRLTAVLAGYGEKK